MASSSVLCRFCLLTLLTFERITMNHNSWIDCKQILSKNLECISSYRICMYKENAFFEQLHKDHSYNFQSCSMEVNQIGFFLKFVFYSSSEGLEGVAPITAKNFWGGNPSRVSKSHVNR